MILPFDALVLRCDAMDLKTEVVEKMAGLQAIVMKAKDNVCTVVEAISPGVEVGMEIGG